MAKTSVKLENGISVKYIVKEYGYCLYRGSGRITIDGKWSGWNTETGYNWFEYENEAVEFGNTLTYDKGINYIEPNKE